MDRMSLQMERGDPAVGMAHDADAGMGPDCAMAMQMNDMSHDGDSKKGSLHKGCQSCQLCMPLAALDAPATFVRTPVIQTVPEPRPRVFVSADTVRHEKPPIS